MRQTAASITTILTAALILAGCGSTGPEVQKAPSTPTPTATEDVEATPTDEVQADAAPSPGATTSSYDLYEVYGASQTDMDATIAEHGPDTVYLAIVRNANPFTTVEISDDELLATGAYTCERLDAGLTLDEVYMEADAEIRDSTSGLGDGSDPASLAVGELVWGLILPAVDTHCPQHREMREAWYAAAH